MGANSLASNTTKQFLDDLFTSRDQGHVDPRRIILASRIRLVFVFPLMCLIIYAYLASFSSRNWPAYIQFWLLRLIVVMAVTYLIANCAINFSIKWPRLIQRVNGLILLAELATIQLLCLWGGFLSFPAVLLLIVAVVIYRVGLDYYTALLAAVSGAVIYTFLVIAEITGIIPQYPGMAGSVSVQAAGVNLLMIYMSTFILFVISNYTMNQLTQLNQQLEEKSSIDSMTGIPNRRYFEEHLVKEWRRAMRDLRPLSLIMIDIDNFKKYNDTYGHLKGDECLKKVADCLYKGVHRPSDVVARLGGEEFAVLLPETTLNGAASLAEKLRHDVEMLNIPHKHSDCGGKITISLGVASLVPGAPLHPRDLLKHADKALYQAKQLGKNRVSVDFTLS